MKILENLKQKINIILLSLFYLKANLLKICDYKNNSGKDVNVENLTIISDKKKFRKVEKISNF